MIREMEEIIGNGWMFILFTISTVCGIASAVMFSRPAEYERILFDMLFVIDTILMMRVIVVFLIRG